ncbi:hypothetical protein niasHT_029898 [Heterodera trifolii]|uniref:Uncharacterized protein n=1 Tax=Heterodera trifolii TaxID=157864 RepID=A0ABD2KBE5_9BILA
MKIVNYARKRLPIPKIQLPCKVIGFKCIDISFLDRNAIVFLRRFCSIFDAFPINLSFNTNSNRILKFILRKLWPLIGKNICGMHLFLNVFRSLRKLAPSILNDCPTLRFVSYFADFFTEFPADDSAIASDGQAVAKWLFTALPNNVPKVFKCELDKDVENLASKFEAFKAAFTSASSPANFIVVIWFRWSFPDSVRPFVLTNELTREQLAFKRTDYKNCFLLVRCPIVREAIKWTKWEEEAIGWQMTKSAKGFSTQFPARVIIRSEKNGLLRSD